MFSFTTQTIFRSQQNPSSIFWNKEMKRKKRDWCMLDLNLVYTERLYHN